jgi:hypothetical protein
VRRIVGVLLFFLIVDYLVLPQIAGARKSLSLLARVNVAFILAGMALGAASIIAYGMLTQAVLPRESRPRLFTTIRIELSTLSVSHLVPGGSAAASALGFRLLEQQGVSGSDAGFALAIQGIGSAVVLNVLLWLALVVSIPTHGFNPLYWTAAAAGAVVIGAFGLSVLALTRGEARVARSMRFVARHAPFLDEDKMDALIHRLAARLVLLLADRRLLLSAVGWAAANWLLDAASLEVFVWAFGHRPGVVGLLVSYGLANVLAAIPITPGGLGIVEAVLTSTLVGFGTAPGIAILGVISYRLVSFWVPIPVGGVAYLSLRARRAARERREELARLANVAARAADRPVEWAERLGIRMPRSRKES